MKKSDIYLFIFKKIVIPTGIVALIFGVIWCIIWNLIIVSPASHFEDDSSLETVEISGTNYSVSLSEIDLSDNILSESKEELALKIKCFNKIEKITMCDCGYTNDDMEFLINKCPDINFIWMLHLGIWDVRTDAIAFSTLSTEDAEYRLTNEDARQLKYCTNLELLDIGHNAVTDLSFLEYMPDLKILILMGNRDTENGGYIKDLSALKNCPNLIYLEIFQNSVSDLSFLQYLPKLKDFNMVYNYADDITYLKNLPNIERLYIAYNKFSKEDCIYLQNLYPDAQVEYELRNPIDKGWRDHPRYEALRNMIFNNCSDPLFDMN